jgi:DNA-binding transcriptional ArsR family regulator
MAVKRKIGSNRSAASRSLATAPAPTLVEIAAHAGAAARLLRALGNARRLEILCQLVHGERSVSEINGAVELSQSALSQHLAVLRRDGIVSTRREAQTIYYRIASDPAKQVMQTLYGIYCVPAD